MGNERKTWTPEQPDFVVGVGASAGGLDAFKQLLSALPADTGMAFLLVQHLDPTHPSLLSELLTPHTLLTVRDADQDLVLEANTVYIIQPDTALAVHNGRVALTAPKLQRGVRLPVDHLFRSLAREYGPRAVGIVLSGAGSDGSAGIRAIKNAGGFTLVQSPSTSVQPGMPQSAIDSGAVELVMDISAMPDALARFANMPPRVFHETQPEDQGRRSEPLVALSEQDITRLAAVLEVQLEFDLRVYKPGTIERRVFRRMALSGFDNVDSYIDHLRNKLSEQQVLVRDLLISVTDFFRDPDAFCALREAVITPMVAEARPGAMLRAWVPACATGEEAYSIAMEFLDAADESDKRISLQLFATDIDQDALTTGRTAVYPPTITDQISEKRLTKYFKSLDGRGYQARSRLRDTVSFAVHDLTKDPPFSRMNLVSCRNVLIYLTAEAQQHVLKVLHFALEPGGYLFLSASESTGQQRELFSTISKSQRIYRKSGTSRPISVARSRSRVLDRDMLMAQRSSPSHLRLMASGDAARRAACDAVMPPTIVIAGDGTLLFSHGELSPYLQIPRGNHPKLELSAILRPELATRTRGALYKCRRSQEVVVVQSSPDAQRDRVRIIVRPAPNLSEDAAIITFHDVADSEPLSPADRAEAPGSPGEDAVIEQLEKELLATREDLRTTTEELETSNEELRSSNEESMSMNEELQSANEELEATTEELRSLNEELTTVNSQLREKIEQVEQAHDDLRNFFASAKVTTIFLDDRLCVKRFTPTARELLGIDHADVGRFVGDIARELLQNDLDKECQAVLDQLATCNRELQTSDGRWIARQVLPYRTENRWIEGVVVTFNDVTQLRSANEDLQAKRRRLELAWEAARGGIFEHRIPLDKSTFHSEQWARILGYRQDELPPYDQFMDWVLQLVHPDDRASLAHAYQEFTAGRAERYRVEFRIRHRTGPYLWVRGVSKALERDDNGQVRHVLGIMIDITDLKEVEASLRESEERFREMTDGLPLIVWVHGPEGEQEFVNSTYCDFFGVKREEMRGARWQRYVHPEDAERYLREFYACVAEQRPFHAEVRAQNAAGQWRWLEAWGRPRRAASGEFRGFVGTSADITERKKMEEDLRESDERFKNLADNIAQLAWMSDRDGNTFWINKRMREYTGLTMEDMRRGLSARIHHPDYIESVSALRQESIMDGAAWEDVFPLRGADGEYRWFLCRAIPILNEHNKVLRWCGTATDITEQRMARERLLEADRQKDAFLAMLGHELRNPLSAIRSAADVLSKDPDAETILQAQHVLERQSRHMAGLLDGLLDVSRIIHGKIQLQLEPVDLVTICNDVIHDLRDMIAEQQLKVASDVPVRPVWVKADRMRLAQIVENLLSNAVKYTPSGGSVTLDVNQDGGQATMTVRDTGIGIDVDLLPHVFDVFRQSEQNLDRSRGGLGLGLALVRSLVELHGGTIAARSDGLDRGAEFTLSLPTVQPSQTPKNRVSRETAKNLRLVIVEDNVDAAEMLRRALVRRGHEVFVANHARQGIDLARAERPDIVLCDLGLPGELNGFDVARALREDKRQVGLIAVSGYGRGSDISNSREAGFDTHMTKPLDFEQLERAMTDLMGSQAKLS